MVKLTKTIKKYFFRVILSIAKTTLIKILDSWLNPSKNNRSNRLIREIIEAIKIIVII